MDFFTGQFYRGVQLACDKIEGCPTGNDGICPTPPEKNCLRSICRNLRTQDVSIQLVEGATYGGQTDEANMPPFGKQRKSCHIRLDVSNLDISDQEYLETHWGVVDGVQRIAYGVIHELLHCCGRGDNNGPFEQTNVLDAPYDEFGSTDPADDGARCCMGLGPPYLPSGG
jgi:hypothetical protein